MSLAPPRSHAAGVTFAALATVFVCVPNSKAGAQTAPDREATEPDEIVVTATVPRSRARLYLPVGLDRLSACSSLTYAKATKTLTLRCLPL